MATLQKNEIKISVLTGKLKGFKAINTNTLSNEFCTKMRKTSAVCRACYSASMLQGIRKNCVKPWENNSRLLSESLLDDHQIPNIFEHTIRLHAHGELINYTHLLNYIAIANRNPRTTFAIWTKRKNLIRRAIKAGLIPDNFILIYSHPKTDKTAAAVPVGFDKAFSASDSGAISTGEFECTGKSCADCMACYRKTSGHNFIVEKIK